MAKWFLTGLSLLFLICGSYELTCYDCTDCNDPFHANQTTVIKCTGTCAKTKLLYSSHVTRFCNPKDFPEELCRVVYATGDGKEIDACVCNTDMCNAAFRFKIYISFALSIIRLVLW